MKGASGVGVAAIQLACTYILVLHNGGSVDKDSASWES